MLIARAVSWSGAGAALHPIDLVRFSTRAVTDAWGEHVRVDTCGRPVRLDAVEGTLLAGPAFLTFELGLGPRLSAQLAALGELRLLLAGRRAKTSMPQQLHRQLLALAAHDARTDGVNLRMIADILLGRGDWPGDGEHRKSRVRRLITKGAAMVRAGPRAIMS